MGGLTEAGTGQKVWAEIWEKELGETMRGENESKRNTPYRKRDE